MKKYRCEIAQCQRRAFGERGFGRFHITKLCRVHHLMWPWSWINQREGKER